VTKIHRIRTGPAAGASLLSRAREVGEPRTGCGIPDTVIGLAACDGFAVDVVGDPVAVCCPGDCPDGVAISGVPGSGGRPPRPPRANELPGRPPRAAHATRNWLLASKKVSGRTTKLPATSVFGAVMVMVPETLSSDAARITESELRMSWPVRIVMSPPWPS
jgi:hypothetical protein